MAIKTKAWVLAAQIALLWIFMFFLSQSADFVVFYSSYIYPAVQSFRLVVLSIIPFSMGDILYLAGGLWLLLTLVRWVYYIRKFGAYKDKLAGSMLNTINTSIFLYFLFLVGWGANYSKMPLGKTWNLNPARKGAIQARESRNLAEIVAFNKFLLHKVNNTAPRYIPIPYSHINDRAIAYYREFTNSKVKQNGLGVKPTLYGYFMQRMGIDGYYNPFTGEGQVNKRLPTFMMPFTISHEMAHQAGIAAEGDANLMAYAIGTIVNDPLFQYSAYLNLWLYANNRLFRYDSAMAVAFSEQLNPLTRAHIDTLEQISQKYHGAFTRYTSDIYDSYLRMQNQQEGIRSYGNVTREAWLLELGRKNGSRKNILIRIP